MGVYIGLYIGIMGAFFLEKSQKQITIFSKTITTKKISSIICFLLIWFIGVFRYRFLGVDVVNYGEYFDVYIDSLSWWKLLTDFTMDNGYYLFNKIVKIFTDNYWVFKGILFTVTFSIFHFTIKKFSKNVAFSYIVFLGAERLVGLFCILRQEVAISFCAYSIRYIKDKNWKKFILIILVAATFHKTALVFLLAYVFVYMKKDNIIGWKNKYLQRLDNKYVLATVGISLISLIGVPILLKVYPIDYSGGMVLGSGTTKLAFIIFTLIVCAVVKNKMNLKERQEISLFFDICYCSLFPQIIAFFFPIFSRITSYFFVCFMFLVPNIIKDSNIKKKGYITFFYILAFGVLFFISLFGGDIVPYVFEFER